MKSVNTLLGSLLLILGSTAAAYQGPGSGNGGDSVALEFTRSAQEAVHDVTLRPDLYPELDGAALSARLAQTKILVSSKPLYVNVNGVQQMSVAVNFNSPDRIVISRAGWNGIRESQQRKALALHELISLAGVEKSGDYHVSQRMAKGETQLTSALLQNRELVHLTGMRLRQYDCLITGLDATGGRCHLVFEKDGKTVPLTASAEVAAPWAISSKYSVLQWDNLTLDVTAAGEVLTIDDAEGNLVSKKIDYSR